MTMSPLTSLANVYNIIRVQNPALAAEMADDIMAVSLYALAADKSGGQESANNLRRFADDLPEIQSRVLCGTLVDLGF